MFAYLKMLVHFRECGVGGGRWGTVAIFVDPTAIIHFIYTICMLTNSVCAWRFIAHICIRVLVCYVKHSCIHTIARLLCVLCARANNQMLHILRCTNCVYCTYTYAKSECVGRTGHSSDNPLAYRNHIGSITIWQVCIIL